MNHFLTRSDRFYDLLFSKKSIRFVELTILRLSIFAFLGHILLIFLSHRFEVLANFQHSYLKAIFTPFSFILLYEVFLLIVIIPKSISEFAGKQFEVITLITLRSFFHDIADADIHNTKWISDPSAIGLLYDLAAALLMLSITILYYRLYQKSHSVEPAYELTRFISIKKIVSLLMVSVLIGLGLFSFFSWIGDLAGFFNMGTAYPDPNRVFFIEFFTIMIFIDVLLLIISFMYQFSFFIIFRNASFVITTILIRISLSMEKPENYILVLAGFLFSLIAFYLYRKRPVLK